MSEYLITVTNNVTKHYLIDASSNEEAISTALDYFMEGTGELEEYDTNMSNVNVRIESIGDIEDDELEEESDVESSN